ncbi:MAG TPA: hypothetical protein VLU99_03570 [Nitrososphaerales archaeon]|nr:hypothetical protein [Nitrososphaerales archaeon]HUK74847.1 hypothetical protein [Nitrososphaerales archaeon]
MPQDAYAVASEICRALGVSDAEARLYVTALVEGRLSPSGREEKEVADLLAARGMLIHEARGRSYLPVHPRLALSNLFRAYEEGLARQRKEKRLLVDRLTLELIRMMPGQSKGTNAGGPRGGTTIG